MIKKFCFAMPNISSLGFKSYLVRINALRISSVRHSSVFLRNYDTSCHFFMYTPLRRLRYPYLCNLSCMNQISLRPYSAENKKEVPEAPTLSKENVASEAPAAKLSQRARLKQAVRDYGATIVVFHVAISLASLGISYVAISSGVDAISLLKYIGFSESVVNSKIAVGGSTFVIAYAVHKLFAPVRIAITLSVAPFIVRYLRKINLLKPPKKK